MNIYRKINLKIFAIPNSLGIFYSMITQYLGFQRDSDEYKVMGLSSYGKNNQDFNWLLKNNQGNYQLNLEFMKDVEGKPMPSKQESLYNEKFLSKLSKKFFKNIFRILFKFQKMICKKN